MATRVTTKPVRAEPGILSTTGLAMKYAHGQHAAYVLDRCRCPDCAGSNTIYEKERARRILPAFVLAAQAREHVAWLATQGIGRKRIAAASHVAHGTLCKLMDGDTKRGSAPSKRIRQETHEAIMAVTPADGGANRRIIDAGPTWVLLDEMIAAGIPKTTIGRALLPSATSLQIKRTTVSPENRDKVYALHARWIAGDWAPVKRDRHGNAVVKLAPPRRPITREERISAYDDRAALITALAEAVEARNGRPWRNQAACRGRPSSLWFPQRGDTVTFNAAVKICKACTCRRECLMANLDENEGIYGGMGARARQQLRTELSGEPEFIAVAVAYEHGTNAGYSRHRRLNEDACQPCLAAHARYKSDRDAA